jgi:hypothetical protein
MTELTASNTSGKTEVADTYGVILIRIGKVISTFRHGSNKDAYALLRSQCLDVVLDANNLSLVTKSNLPTVGW